MITLNWINVGTIEEIPRQGARTIETTHGEIAIFRTIDDQFFALDNRCPHKNGPLAQGIVHGHRVTCPLHGWTINLDSGEAVSPDVGCGHIHETKIENGCILLKVKL